MKNLVAFFEIPATDFDRAVRFYETILETKISAYDFGKEKMGFFANNAGAISWADGFKPSKDGVLVHLSCNDITQTLACIETQGGQIITPKTKIEADNAGYFALFSDSEGNRVGLWSK